MRLILIALLSILPAAPAMAACDGRELTANIYQPPVCVPSEPKRIVVLDTLYSMGMAMELGARIVGAPLFGMNDKAMEAEARARKIKDIGHYSQPSPERIIALKPDLILGDAYLHAPAYDVASKVAPTVLFNPPNWRDYHAAIALATGRTGAADEAFKAYDKRVADIKARMPNVTVSVVRIMTGGFQVYTDGPRAYGPYSVLRDVGVKRTAYETSAETTMKRPDWEQIPELTGDVLLYVVGGGYGNDPKGTLEKETLSNPLWQMLPAVKAGRAHRVEGVTWTEFSALASANRVLDDVERYIVKKP